MPREAREPGASGECIGDVLLFPLDANRRRVT
jgi:hypothetical protein